MRSSLSSLHVLVELLAVPFVSRLERDCSFKRLWKLTDVLNDRSAAFCKPFCEPRSLTGELSRVLRFSPRSAADSKWSFNKHSKIGGPGCELQSTTSHPSPECLRRLEACDDSPDTTACGKPLGCVFGSDEPDASGSAAVTSFMGSRFCNTCQRKICLYNLMQC